MSTMHKFEIEILDVLFCGSVQYEATCNDFAGNDPRSDHKIEIDWSSLRIETVSWAGTELDGKFAEAFAEGAIETVETRLKPRIEDEINLDPQFEDVLSKEDTKYERGDYETE